MSDDGQARAETMREETPNSGETPRSEATSSIVSERVEVRRLDVDVVQILGKYRLFAAIGSGGMAEVYLAIAEGRLGFNKLVVIKRLREDLAEEEQFVQMFLDEARLAARLSHPNIVHAYEVGEEEGNYFIAMEYLEGQPLSRIYNRALRAGSRLPRAVAIRIVMDALSGLHYAHELKDYNGKPLDIIHRDISPHNIFVTYDGTVKVVDFGIAKASSNATHTEAGQIKGKVGYMAPEQAVLSAIDRRADLYAMGVVLWEVLTGKRLFPGATLESLPTILTAAIPRVSSVVDGIDEELDEIVVKALRRKADGRFQTAEEMRKALESYLRGHGETVDAQDVGKYVSETFAEVREQVRERVERQMEAAQSRAREVVASGVHAGALSGDTLASSVAPDDSVDVISMGRGKTGSGASKTGSGASKTGSGASTTTSTVPTKQTPTLLVVAVAIVIVGGAGIWVLSRSKTRDTPVATPAPALTMPAQVGSTALGSTSAVKPPPSESPVTVTSEPSGAVITWRGRQVGLTPAIVELPAGTQPIMLTKDGYEATSTTVEVKAGEPLLKAVKLTAIPVRVTRPVAVAPPPPAPTSTVAKTAATAVAPPKPNCTAPYYIDERGIKKIRPECM